MMGQYAQQTRSTSSTQVRSQQPIVQRMRVRIGGQLIDLQKQQFKSEQSVATLMAQLNLNLPQALEGQQHVSRQQLMVNKIAAAIDSDSPNKDKALEVLSHVNSDQLNKWTLDTPAAMAKAGFKQQLNQELARGQVPGNADFIKANPIAKAHAQGLRTRRAVRHAAESDSRSLTQEMAPPQLFDTSHVNDPKSPTFAQQGYGLTTPLDEEAERQEQYILWSGGGVREQAAKLQQQGQSFLMSDTRYHGQALENIRRASPNYVQADGDVADGWAATKALGDQGALKPYGIETGDQWDAHLTASFNTQSQALATHAGYSMTPVRSLGLDQHRKPEGSIQVRTEIPEYRYAASEMADRTKVNSMARRLAGGNDDQTKVALSQRDLAADDFKTAAAAMSTKASEQQQRDDATEGLHAAKALFNQAQRQLP